MVDVTSYTRMVWRDRVVNKYEAVGKSHEQATLGAATISTLQPTKKRPQPYRTTHLRVNGLLQLESEYIHKP